MLNLLALILIAGFAGFRLTWLWRYDSITEPLRQFLWSYFPPEGEPLDKVRRTPKGAICVPVMVDGESKIMVTKGTFIGGLTVCHWCVSAYICMFWTVVAWASKMIVGLSFGAWFMAWFAIWAVAVILLTHSHKEMTE